MTLCLLCSVILYIKNNELKYITLQDLDIDDLEELKGIIGFLEEKYDVKAIKTENDLGYYFFTSMDVGFEKLFDAIEDTISFNQVALLKQQLFMEKIKELQILFEDEPIDVLETIEFKYKKRRGKKNDIKEQEVELCQQES